MTEDKILVENCLEEDMFTSDFVHIRKISITNPNTGKVTEYEFGLKEISGFEEDQISKAAIVKKKDGKIEFKTEEANIAYLKGCLVNAPFLINNENLKKLTSKIRNRLLEEAKKINEIPADVIKK